MTSAASLAGTSGRIGTIGAGVSVMWAAMSCCADALPANGWRPARSSYAITPQA